MVEPLPIPPSPLSSGKELAPRSLFESSGLYLDPATLNPRGLPRPLFRHPMPHLG
jgi:hypothetical protein